MAARPEPVTDLAWSPDQAEDLARRVLGVWKDLLDELPGLPVTTRRTPAETAPAVALPVPEQPMPPEALVAHLREIAFEHTTHVGHPAFFGYVVGAGTVPGAAAELLAAGMNPNLGGYRSRRARRRSSSTSRAGWPAGSDCPRAPAGSS